MFFSGCSSKRYERAEVKHGINFKRPKVSTAVCRYVDTFLRPGEVKKCSPCSSIFCVMNNRIVLLLLFGRGGGLYFLTYGHGEGLHFLGEGW